MKQTITLHVNGRTYTTDVEPRQTLLEVVRDNLGLTGSKEGCGTGDCGACTMIADGRAFTTCLTLGIEMDGRSITTIEGLGDTRHLHPLQQKFVEHGAVQCGFCIPGMIMSAKALLDRNPNPTDTEIRFAIAGNLCRCTGYTKIMAAIRDAAATMRAEQAEPVPADD